MLYVKISTLCILGDFCMVFCRPFFLITFFFHKKKKKKSNLSGIRSECQAVWIQIRPDVLSGLIAVQTVCIGYMLTTKVVTSGGRVKNIRTATCENVQSDMLPS